jgi:hypothetical protein
MFVSIASETEAETRLPSRRLGYLQTEEETRSAGAFRAVRRVRCSTLMSTLAVCSGASVSIASSSTMGSMRAAWRTREWARCEYTFLTEKSTGRMPSLSMLFIMSKTDVPVAV